MHIVFVSYTYSPGFSTPESWVERIKAFTGSLECMAEKHTISRVDQINHSGKHLHNGVNYYFTDFRKHKYSALKLNRFVRELQPDVVVVEGLIYPLQTIQLRLLLPKKTRIIAQHHAEVPFVGLKKQAQRLADKCIDAYLFAATQMGLDWVVKGIISSETKVHEVMEVSSVFYEIDKSFSKTKTNTEGAPVFIWVGRLNANKDPLTAVKAFLKYTTTNASARLYMIYHTDELLNEIQFLLADHPNKNSVVMIGQVPNKNLLYWYNSADFVISASHYEGSGTAVAEAMSCGCIPVVSDIPSFRMITDNGNCGLLFEPGNETALYHALLKTAQLDLSKKREMSLNYFHSNLSFQAIGSRIIKVAEGLLK